MERVLAGWNFAGRGWEKEAVVSGGRAGADLEEVLRSTGFGIYCDTRGTWRGIGQAREGGDQVGPKLVPQLKFMSRNIEAQGLVNCIPELLLR